MKNFYNRYKTEITVFAIFLMLLLITFLPQVLSGLAFAEGYDIRQQHYPFFVEFRTQWLNFFSGFPNHLSDGLPFYSWNMFLGSNFWAAKAYYTVGDLYNYLFLPLENMHYFDIRFLQTLLKFSMAALSSFLYLKKFYKKTSTLVIGVISYAFSLWIVFFIGQPMFLSFYSLIPFYFLGMECYLQDKKKILFISMTAILLCINYYLFFTISFLSVVYYIYRYVCLGKSQKDFIKDTVILIGYYFVGVLMTMVLIYPAGLYMLSNQRVGGMEFQFAFPDFKVYFHMIQSLFSPSLMLGTEGVFAIGIYRYDEIPFWAGLLTTLLVPQFLSDNDERFKKATLALYGFFLLFYIFPLGSSMLHGFSEANFRWLFFVLFINIFITCRYLESLDKINIENLKRTTLVAVCVAVLAVPVTAFFTGQLQEFQNFIIQYGFDIFIAGLLFLAALLIIKKPKWLQQGLVGICCVGIISVSGQYRLTHGVANSWEYIERRSNGLQSENKELLQFLKSNGEPIDTMYYRFFIDYEELYAKYSLNSSLLYKINDLMTYDSTISPAIYDLEQFKDADFFDQAWVVNFKNPGIVNFLSTEYAVVVNPSILPHKNFELIGDYFGIPVYRNLDVVPFGSTYSKVTTYQELINTNSNTTDKLAEFIIVDTVEEKKEVESSLKSQTRFSMKNIQYGGNHLSGTFSTDEESFTVIQLPYDEGWNILVQGTHQKVYRVNGGMMGVILPKGESFIEMFFIPKGLKEGAVLTIVGFLLYLGIIFVDIKKRKANSTTNKN